MTPEERRQKKNQESRESYNWYKAHHVCVRCNTAPAADGLVTCQACREAVNARHRFWYAGLTPEEKAERSAKKKGSQRGTANRWALHPMRQEARRPEPFNVRTLQERR